MCTITGGTIRINLTRWGAVTSYYRWSFCNLLEVSNVTVEHNGGLNWVINVDDPANPQMLSAVARGSINEIIIADDSNARENLIPSLSVGTRVKLRGSSTIGTVTNISYSGGKWVIRGNWTNTVQVGQVWEFCNVQQLCHRNVTVVGSSVPVLRPLHPTQQLLA